MSIFIRTNSRIMMLYRIRLYSQKSITIMVMNTMFEVTKFEFYCFRLRGEGGGGTGDCLKFEMHDIFISLHHL